MVRFQNYKKIIVLIIFIAFFIQIKNLNRLKESSSDYKIVTHTKTHSSSGTSTTKTASVTTISTITTTSKDYKFSVDLDPEKIDVYFYLNILNAFLTDTELLKEIEIFNTHNIYSKTDLVFGIYDQQLSAFKDVSIKI